MHVTVSAEYLRELAAHCTAGHVTVSRWLPLPLTTVVAMRLFA